MTGYTVHTGTSDEFADGWDRIFANKPGGSSAKAKKQTASKSAKPKAIKKAGAEKKKKAARKKKP